MQLNTSIARSEATILQTNKVIRNTYILLSMTLVFSAITAFVGVISGASFGMALGADIVAIVLLWFVLPRTANSASGIPVIFGITGLLGYGLGPVLSHYLAVNPSIVMTALGGTGAIFLALSGYALTTRKDFSFPRSMSFILSAQDSGLILIRQRCCGRPMPVPLRWRSRMVAAVWPSRRYPVGPMVIRLNRRHR